MASSSPERSILARYSVAVGATLAATLVRWFLEPLLGHDQPVLLYTLGITLSAWWGGLGPGLLTTVLSTVIGTWAFIEPVYSFEINTVADVTRIVILVTIGLAISLVSETMHQAARRSREREAALQRSTERLDALAESASLLLRKETPETAVDELCRKVMSALDCQVFVNYLVDDRSGKLRLNAHAGIPGDKVAGLNSLTLGETICGGVARDGQPVALSEAKVKNDPRAVLMRDIGVRAYACNPMTIANRTLGTISFGSTTHAEFSAEDLSLMRTVTDYVGIAMQRKLNREALRSSEERYRAFIATSLEAIWRIEFDHPIDTKLPAPEQISQMFEYGHYAEANDALARLYGWDRAEEVVGLRVKNAESLEHEPTLVSYRQFIEGGYMRTGEVSFERDRHGGVRYFLNNYVGIVEGGFLIRIWGSSLDVTERRKAEADLRAQTALLLGISESITDLVFAKNRESRITFANPATLAVIGKPEDQVLGHTDADWAANPEEARAILENDRRIMSEGRPMVFDERFEGRIYESKKAPLHDANGAVIGLVGVGRDVTELKQMQAAIQESEARFRLMADSAPVLIWLAERGKGCTWFNQQWLTFTGRDLAQELGDGWLENVHPDDAERCRHIFTTNRDRQAAFQLEFRLRRGDGSYRWVLNHSVPRFGPEGEYLGHLGSCVDITNRKEAEEQLLKAKAAAETANKAKDDFLAALSHELRTPLTPVLFLAGESINDPTLDEERREDWRTVHKNITLQARLIDDLLDLTRIARGKLSLQRQILDAHTVLNDAMAMVRSDIEAKKIKLTSDLDARQRQVQGDPMRLQQVFGNVLQNAVKFTPQGGSIFVQTRNLDGNGMLLVEIADTGIGLTAEEMERVFDTFSQGDHATNRNTIFGGLGLGLAITREVLHMHSGRISVSSAGRNRGAIFTIELPTCSCPEPAAS